MGDAGNYKCAIRGHGINDQTFGENYQELDLIPKNRGDPNFISGKKMIRPSFSAREGVRLQDCPLLSKHGTIMQPQHWIGGTIPDPENLLAPFAIERVQCTLMYYLSTLNHVSKFAYPAPVKKIVRSLIDNLMAAHDMDQHFPYLNVNTIYLVSPAQGAVEKCWKNVKMEKFDEVYGVSKLECAFALGYPIPPFDGTRAVVEKRNSDFKKIIVILEDIRASVTAEPEKDETGDKKGPSDNEMTSLEGYIKGYVTMGTRGGGNELERIRGHPAMWMLPERMSFIMWVDETMFKLKHDAPSSHIGLTSEWYKDYEELKNVLSGILDYKGETTEVSYGDKLRDVVRFFRNIYAHYGALQITKYSNPNLSNPQKNFVDLLYKNRMIFVNIWEYVSRWTYP